jgi:integrase
MKSHPSEASKTMASFEFDPKTGKARFFFRYGGRQFNKTLPVKNDREADRIRALIEETVVDLVRGKLTLPPEADQATFILSGGKVAVRPQAVSNPFQEAPPPPTLRQVFDTYAATLTPGSKEANSIETEGIHQRHFVRILGEGFAFDSLGVDLVQGYVDARAREGVGRETIRKELSTLRVICGWAYKRKHVHSPLGWKMKDLTLPKAGEKPPFQTWVQITRKIERGGLTRKDQADLWECLWLDEDQTMEVLAWVRENARYPFLHPMFAFAAFTGARRSEMIRSEREDWDFDAGIVSIREKKADRAKTFTRRNVTLHPALSEIMAEWFRVRPGGPWTICTANGAPIGPRMATKYFRGALSGSKWAVLHGWHTFRHSLASNMASAGVDQRVINEILGHHTQEMERRYRHLLPRKQAHALHSLFQVTG